MEVKSYYLAINNYKEENKKKCLFCSKIEQNQVLYKNEFFYLIKDKYPSGKSHYLIITQEHIETINSLDTSHKELVIKLKEFALDFIEKSFGIKNCLLYDPCLNKLEYKNETIL